LEVYIRLAPGRGGLQGLPVGLLVGRHSAINTKLSAKTFGLS